MNLFNEKYELFDDRYEYQMITREPDYSAEVSTKFILSEDLGRVRIEDYLNIPLMIDGWYEYDRMPWGEFVLTGICGRGYPIQKAAGITKGWLLVPEQNLKEFIYFV